MAWEQKVDQGDTKRDGGSHYGGPVFGGFKGLCPYYFNSRERQMAHGQISH